jgi:cell division protein FtsL
MARAAATAAARSSSASPARPRAAPARRRPVRRASGPAAAPRAGVALPPPLRVLDVPFARALRTRTSGVLDALLAGRGWIALVGVLLVGIVFFNVDLLRMNREIALTAERGAVLKRENARLRREAALLGSSQRIQDAAAELGMVLPTAGEVRFLTAHPPFDARKAARRIVEPNDLALAPVPTVTTTDPVATPTTPEPTATSTPEPAPLVPEATVPAQEAAPTTVPPAG